MRATMHPNERTKVQKSCKTIYRSDKKQVRNKHLPITHTQLQIHLTRVLNHEWKWQAYSFPKECHGSNTGAYGSTKHECRICADMTYILKWGLSARFLVLPCLKFLSRRNFSLVETFHFLYQLILCTVTWCDHLTTNKQKVQNDKHY